MQFYGRLKQVLCRQIKKRPRRIYNSYKVLSFPKSEFKYGVGDIFSFLVEEAQVKNKMGRTMSSHEDKGPIDTSCLNTSLERHFPHAIQLYRMLCNSSLLGSILCSTY